MIDPEQQDFIDRVNGVSPSTTPVDPGGNGSISSSITQEQQDFLDRVNKESAPPPPSLIPHTDAASSQSQSLFGRMFGGARLATPAEYIHGLPNVPTVPVALAGAVQSFNAARQRTNQFREQMGGAILPTSGPGITQPLWDPPRMEAGISDVPTFDNMGRRTGTHKASTFEAATHNMANSFVSGFTSARGLIETLPPVFLAETAYHIPDLIRQVQEAEKTPPWSQERWEAGLAVTGTLATLGFMGHAGLGLIKPRKGVTPRVTELSPAGVSREAVPESLQPKLPAEAEEEAVGEPVEQTTEGEPDVTRVESTRPVSELEIRPQVGEKAPLRGEPEGPAGAQEPISTGETVVPEVPREAPEVKPSPYFIESHAGGYWIVDRRKPGDVVPTGRLDLDQAQRLKARLDEELQEPQPPPATPPPTIARGGPEPPPRDTSGTAEAAIANARRAEMYGLTEDEDFPDVAGGIALPKGPVAPEVAQNAMQGVLQGNLDKTLGDIKQYQTDNPGKGIPLALTQKRDALIEQLKELVPTTPKKAAEELAKQTADEERRAAETREAAALTRVKPIKNSDTSSTQTVSHPVEPSRLSPVQQERLDSLQQTRADQQNDLGDYIEARHKRLTKDQQQKLADTQMNLWNTWDNIHALWEQSGQPWDTISIGGGAGGLKLAGHQAYEGKRVLVLEKSETTGGAAKRSLELFNVGEQRAGVEGRSYFLEKALTARNGGAMIRTQSDVIDIRPRPDGTVDVVTGRRNPDGSVVPGQIYHGNRVALMTGSRAMTPKELKSEYPGHELAGWDSNAEKLFRGSKGKTGMAVGGANSVTQAVLGSIRKGVRKVVVVSRSGFNGREVSANQYDRVKSLERQKKIQLVSGSIDRITKTPNGSLEVHVGPSKAFPKADATFTVAHVENFLARKLNTGSLPEGIQLDTRQGNALAGYPVRVMDASRKTTMPGVYAGGDVRAALPGEEKGSRIDLASGDAVGISNNILKELAIKEKTGKLPPWEASPQEIHNVDQELKRLKGVPEEEITGEAATTPGSQAQPSRDLLKPTAAKLPSLSTPRTPSIEPARPKPEAPRPPVKPPVQRPAPSMPGEPGISPLAGRGAETRSPMGWDEALQHGHGWLDAGGNINSVVQKFRSTGNVDSWDMGRMLAYRQRLERTTNNLGDQLAKRPKDVSLQNKFNDAAAVENNFTQANYAPMETMFKSRNPETFQGHEPLDPAAAQSFTGLSRRFAQFHEKPMTARDINEARSIAERAKQENTSYRVANGDLYKKMDSEYSRIRSDRKTPPTLDDLGKTFTQMKEVCG
jgi:thioredoxin reductase